MAGPFAVGGAVGMMCYGKGSVGRLGGPYRVCLPVRPFSFLDGYGLGVCQVADLGLLDENVVEVSRVLELVQQAAIKQSVNGHHGAVQDGGCLLAGPVPAGG